MSTPIYEQTLATWPARDRDPSTSHAAVPSVSKVWQIQARILDILTDHGPLTHNQIRGAYLKRHGPTPGSSPASIRTRTSELHKTWRVVALDRKGRTASGRAAVRWALRREEQS